MNRLAVGILATLFLLSSITRATQNPATDSNRGSLEGSVLDSVTGQPIEGAQVAIVTGQALTEAGVQSLLADQKPTLQVPQITKVIPAFVLSGRTLMPDRSAHSVLTDARGKFILTSLAPGAYSVAVRADGYNFQVYGEKPYSLAALPVDIREGKVNIGVIRMNPEPRVSGAIIDLAGRPIATIPVYLLRTQPWFDVDGKRQFRVAGEMMTDAAGRYVLEKISAGRYYVAAGSFGRRDMISFSSAAPAGVRQPAILPYPFTYYPGVPDVGLAGQIDVPAGIKVALGDMVMTQGELRAIRGRAVDYATGKPPASVRVTLNTWFPILRNGRDGTEMLSNGAYDRNTGVFEFTNLIPGHYRIDAQLPRPQSSTPTLTIMGGVSPQSAFQMLELTNADVNDLVLTVPGSGRVTGKVVVADGKPLPVAESNLPNLPIPLQLMLRPLTALQPAPIVTAVSTGDGSFEVAPLPEIISFYQLLYADASGRFTVNGVPPGNFKIYVWEGLEPSQFFDREQLARSRGLAFPVHMEKGASVSASVPIIVE